MTLPTLPPSAALDALTGALCKGVRRFDSLPHDTRATYCQPCPVRLACIAQGLHGYEPHTWGAADDDAKRIRTALAQQRRSEKDDDPLCTVDGCYYAVRAKGMCDRHYRRAKRGTAA